MKHCFPSDFTFKLHIDLWKTTWGPGEVIKIFGTERNAPQFFRNSFYETELKLHFLTIWKPAKLQNLQKWGWNSTSKNRWKKFRIHSWATILSTDLKDLNQRVTKTNSALSFPLWWFPKKRKNIELLAFSQFFLLKQGRKNIKESSDAPAGLLDRWHLINVWFKPSKILHDL